MATLVDHRRFEDAALVRDRWESLSRALTSRRARKSLEAAGRIDALGADGVRVVIDRGRLVALSPKGGQMPFLPPSDSTLPLSIVTMADVEETMLAWRWLSRTGVQVVEIEGTLTCPSAAIPSLVVSG